MMALLGYGNRKRSAFANKINVSDSYLSDVVNLKSGPSFGIILGIAENFPTANVNWLLTGDGDPLWGASISSEVCAPIYNDGIWVGELLKKAGMILNSGNSMAADALARNIDYFHHAIEQELRLARIEQEIEAVKRVVHVAAAEKIRSQDPPEHKDRLVKMRAVSSFHQTNQ